MRQLCFLAGFLVAASVAEAAAPYDAPGNGNPLVPGYFAAAGAAPVVADVAGRIALRFDGKAKWQSGASVGAGLTEQGAWSVALAVQCDERRAIGEIINWAGGAGLDGLDAQAAVEGATAWRSRWGAFTACTPPTPGRWRTTTSA